MSSFGSLISFLLQFFISIQFIKSRQREPLRFKKDHTFSILQFTDLHYGESNKLDTNSSRLTEFLINKTNPDLVAITGDSVSGYMWDHKDYTWSKKMWRNWTNVFAKTKTKYAYTFGNHDAEADYSREEIYELELTNPYSYMYRTYDIHGVSNYILPIYSSFTNSSDLGAVLWFFDSNRQGCGNLNESQTWGCIEEDQVNWYSSQSQSILNNFGKRDGVAFFHIPISEYRDAYNWKGTYGTRNEGVNCPKFNTKVFEAMKKWDNIHATFAGHDHNNDYGGEYKGIDLVYGRKTGYGGYGPDFFQRGARIITLTESLDRSGNINLKIEHKVIQEDGTYDIQSKSWKFWDYQFECVY